MLLSVIIPVYNTAKYLKKCIDSVRNQTYKDLEIILVDDGSTDDSFIICDQYACNNTNIKVIHQKNKGLLQARLNGARMARGRYITFVDSDDWISKEMYEKMLTDIQDEDLVTTGIVRYYDEMKQDRRTCFQNEVYLEKDIHNKVFSQLLWNFNTDTRGFDPSMANKIIKRELFMPYIEKAAALNIYLGEDAVVIYPLMQKVKKMKTIEGCYYFHRQRVGGEIPPYIENKNFFEELHDLYQYLIYNMENAFVPQIEMYYLNMLNLRKKKYFNIMENEGVYYPLDVISKDTKFILYGAGNYGNAVYQMYQKTHYGNLIKWVDKNYQNLHNEIPIFSPNDILNEKYDYILIAVCAEALADQIREELIRLGVPKEKILWKKIKQTTFAL